MKKRMTALLTASLIAALGLTTAFAGAPEAAPSQTPIKNECNYAAPHSKMMRGPGPVMRGEHKVPPGFQLLAELTGKDTKVVMDECVASKKLPAQYAKEKGVYTKYKEKTMENAKKRLSKRVADGKLTQEKMDKHLTQLSKRLDAASEGKRPARISKHKGRGPMMPGMIRGTGYFKKNMPMDTLAKLTNKDVKEIKENMRKEGRNCYGEAKAAGVLAEYKAERIKANKTILDKMVKDGKLTQERADAALTAVTKRIENNQPERPFRHRPMHPGPQMRPRPEAK